MSTIVMVGGGVQETRAVQAVHSLGYEVLVTDRNSEAPAFREADFTLIVDGRDLETLTAGISLLKKELDVRGVFTLTELVTSVAAVAEVADLPGVSFKAAVACQHKGLAKTLWLEQGIATPKGGVATSIEKAVEIFEGFQGTAFAKPAVAFGGQGASKIETAEELAPILGASQASPFVVEEAISGSMHDVNGLFDRDGVFHPLGIVDREFLPDHVVEQRILTPSQLSTFRQQELYSLLEQGTRALGVNFGPVKGDCVVSASGSFLLEVAPRLHGPRSSLYALPISGFSPLLPTILVLSGTVPPDEAFEIQQNRYCVGSALLPPPGRLREITGTEEAESLDGMEDLLLFAQPGTKIGEYRDSTQIPGYVFVSGKTVEDCQRTTQQVKDLVQFITEP